MTTYEALLRAAAKVKMPPPGPEESDADFFTRLALAIGTMPIPEFEAIAHDARVWFDDAADALSTGALIPAPGGFDRGLTTPREVTPGRIARPNGSAVLADRPPPLPPAPKPNVPRAGEPINAAIARLLIAAPELSLDQLMTRLGQHKVKAARSTVAPLRTVTLTILRLAREAGWKPPDA